MFRLRSVPVLVLASLISVGCGGGVKDKFSAARKPTVPASGVVTQNGKPVEGATVVLEPMDPAGVAASAVTTSSGSFALEAYPGVEGAVSGSYKVSVTKVEQGSNVMLTDATHDEPAAKGKKPASLIPAKYGKTGTSGLTADIPASGTDSLAFDLKD